MALVFALFELNPAPFCLLDEVDAPLDDYNVNRFCELVREMAQEVQFIVVTHNKITMELTQQLVGVTMNEPGVSRLVAVDLDAAIEAARRLIEIEPEDPLSHTNLSRLLQQQGRIPEAEAAMASAMRLQMKNSSES